MSDFEADQNALNGSFAKFGMQPLNDSLMGSGNTKQQEQPNGSFAAKDQNQEMKTSFELGEKNQKKESESIAKGKNEQAIQGANAKEAADGVGGQV